MNPSLAPLMSALDKAICEDMHIAIIMKTQKTNLVKPAYKLAGLMFGIILTIVFSSCQTKKTKEQISRLEFSKDSLVQNLHQRDSLLGDMMNAFGLKMVEIVQEEKHNKNSGGLISARIFSAI